MSARPSEENFALPEPARSPKSKKQKARALPKPEKLRLAHH